MAQLKWDATGERFYETGTKNGVLYRKNASGTAYEKGVAWNGLTAISESPSGAEETALYADDIKYLSLRSAEEFGATVEAYTYPDEWAVCDGSASLAEGVYVGQQTRRGFGMSYVTVLGNDGMGNDYGEKIHIIYNAMASPSEKSYATINDSPEAITFSWELTTTPIDMPTVNGVKLKKSATLVIDTTKISSAALTAIENALYGTDGDNGTDPKLLMPEEIIQIIEQNPVSSGSTEETPSEQTPDRYEFTSYDDQEKTTMYATGVAEIVSSDGTYTTIKVISNTVESWVNQTFKVEGTTYTEGAMYELLNLDGSSVGTGVWVEIGPKVTA